MMRKPDGVSVTPLRIGSGGVVYLVSRRVGRHLDCEQAPDEIITIEQAVEFAAKRWRVPAANVTVKPEELVEVE